MAWIGISLTCRSTLFALPGIVLGWAIWRLKLAWKKAALLLLCAYAAVIPWTMRNAWHFHAFVPFERHAATANIYTASLGVLHNIRNDQAAQLAERQDPGFQLLDPEAKNRLLLALAVRNIRAHPWGYVERCARRGSFLIGSLTDLTGWSGFVLLLLGAVAALRRPAVAALGALLAYWLVIHSLLSSGQRYLLPMLPIAGILAGAGFCAVLGPLCAQDDFCAVPVPNCGDRVIAFARGLAVLLYVLSLGCMAHEIWALPAGSGVIRPIAAGATSLDKGPSLTFIAEASQSDVGQARQMAGLYREMGDPRRAMQLLLPLAPRHPRDAGLLLDLADVLVGCGEPRSALIYLGQASHLPMPPEDSGHTAILFQQMGEYGSALSILDRLIREHPAEARWRSDRGIVKMLMGQRAEAAEDFRAAIVRDSKFAPAYLSLGSLYASSGQRQAAVKIYQEGLSRVGPSGDSELLKRLRHPSFR